MEKFISLTECEQREVTGGALAGALAGAVFGGCAGLVAWMVTGGAGGAKGCWKLYTACALTGAAIGCGTPV